MTMRVKYLNFRTLVLSVSTRAAIKIGNSFCEDDLKSWFFPTVSYRSKPRAIHMFRKHPYSGKD